MSLNILPFHIFSSVEKQWTCWLGFLCYLWFAPWQLHLILTLNTNLKIAPQWKTMSAVSIDCSKTCKYFITYLKNKWYNCLWIPWYNRCRPGMVGCQWRTELNAKTTFHSKRKEATIRHAIDTALHSKRQKSIHYERKPTSIPKKSRVG